ncbi:MAG TPA: outer membrane beta-barrel protein [Thermoguttaceae bacterium]|nr:outer membrane beta-barrel protein [Thermoguttaceae bacterium]
MGMVEGSTLVDDWVGGKRGFFGGYRLGWDYDHYWGYEMRLGFGNIGLCDSHRAKQAQQAADDAQELDLDDPFRRRFDRRRDLTTTVWDVSLLYYPWGDATWRPYLMAGLGVSSIEFIDRLSTRYGDTVFGMPLAVGVKYRCNEWLALRLELADNIGFGGSFNGVHHMSLTGGAELRFGGSRVAYWPWNPGRHYW